MTNPKEDATATITRTQVYHRGRPGFAWTWSYTVAIPGHNHTYSGDTLSWARDLAKRKGATKIIETWRPA